MTYHQRHFANSQPAVFHDSGLDDLMSMARKAPFLSLCQEQDLARRWRDSQDTAAMDTLVRSHIRLVVKMASKFAGYGQPIKDLVSEGHIGLVEAIRRFDPDKGFRLSTYASWWIDAMLKGYVLGNWSLVKVGTTAEQKRLFFALRRMKGKIAAVDEGDLPADAAANLATHFGVSSRDVIDMDRRLRGDKSLNVSRAEDSQVEMIDLLEDGGPTQDADLSARDEAAKRHDALMEAVSVLDHRERDIFEGRRLSEEQMTLEDLAKVHGVSRERIRQIEVKAMEKVSKAMMEISAARGLIPVH